MVDSLANSMHLRYFLVSVFLFFQLSTLHHCHFLCPRHLSLPIACFPIPLLQGLRGKLGIFDQKELWGPVTHRSEGKTCIDVEFPKRALAFLPRRGRSKSLQTLGSRLFLGTLGILLRSLDGARNVKQRWLYQNKHLNPKLEGAIKTV